jgi:hypothetical protein
MRDEKKSKEESKKIHPSPHTQEIETKAKVFIGSVRVCQLREAGIERGSWGGNVSVFVTVELRCKTVHIMDHPPL